MPNEQQYLELSGIAPPRQKVRIIWPGNADGDIYEIVGPEDLGPIALHDIGRKWDECTAIWNQDKRITKAQEKRLVALLNQLARTLIPDAPARAVQGLPYWTKRNLVSAFLGEAGAAMMNVALGLGSLPGTSPLDSNGSTEELLTAG